MQTTKAAAGFIGAILLIPLAPVLLCMALAHEAIWSERRLSRRVLYLVALPTDLIIGLGVLATLLAYAR